MQDLLTWVGMTVIAVILAIVGPMKLQYASYVERRGSAWARDVGPARTRLIGVMEIVIAIGIFWPLAVHADPWLSVGALLAAAVLFFGACWLHGRRAEREMAGVTGLLGVLALTCVWGVVY
ncbi:MAG: DoxX family protein [Chloroflexota bacterium]